MLCALGSNNGELFVRKRLSSMLLASAVALSSLVGASGAALPVDEPVDNANERIARAAADYWGEHPQDYVGLAREIRAHGGDSVSFAVEGHGAVTAHKAQQLYDQSVRDRENDGQRSGQAGVLDVPADSFNVTGSWYHVQDQYGEWWSAMGLWDFRDDYINGSDPGDASGIAASVPDCWVNDGEYIAAFDYENNLYEGALIRQNAGLSSSVYDVDDMTSGFKMLTDHGLHVLSFKRYSSGCATEPMQARYYYEHNQDGSGSWSFSINLAIFALSYSAGEPATLQKATEVFHT